MRGRAVRQSGGDRGFGLFDPAGIQHGFRPEPNPLLQHLRFRVEPQCADGIAEAVKRIFLQFQNRTAGQQADFQRADQAAATPGPTFQSAGVQFGHAGSQRPLPCFGVVECIQLFAQSRIRRKVVQSVKERPQVKPGSSRQNRLSSPAPNPCDGFVGKALEREHVDPFMKVETADQVVRNLRAFLFRRLRRADLQPAVELH
ncbi:hypothetical protein SDC9_157182 [bioreactor metagenome]|uniref:Uncharacterized protein n=1 Tax=bioreactor metagenome TaxID=1076179 RepID=A0A645F978_9ZZZZ